MNVNLPFRTRSLILRGCIAVIGAACVIGGCSLDTRPTGMGPTKTTCYPPTSVHASANTATGTNTYVMTGTCLETETSIHTPGSAPATAQSTHPYYTVTGKWECQQHTAIESIVYTRLAGTNMKPYPPVKAQEVSSCSNDPWINSVKCTSGPVQGLASSYEAGMVGIKGPFPITAGHINVGSTVGQLISSVAPPTITVPTPHQLILVRQGIGTPIAIVVRGSLPCGVASKSAWVSFQVQTRFREQGGGMTPWAGDAELDQFTGNLVNHRATVRIPMNVGEYRIRTYFTPSMGGPRGKAGPWRYFKIAQGELHRMSPSQMVVPRHLVIPPGGLHMK